MKRYDSLSCLLRISKLCINSTFGNPTCTYIPTSLSKDENVKITISYQSRNSSLEYKNKIWVNMDNWAHQRRDSVPFRGYSRINRAICNQISMQRRDRFGMKHIIQHVR